MNLQYLSQGAIRTRLRASSLRLVGVHVRLAQGNGVALTIPRYLHTETSPASSETTLNGQDVKHQDPSDAEMLRQ